MKTLNDTSFQWFFRNLSFGDLLSGNVTSEIVHVDTAKYPYLSFPSHKYMDPSVYRIRYEGAESPNGPWTLYAALSQANEAATFNGGTSYDLGNTPDGVLTTPFVSKPFLRVVVTSLVSSGKTTYDGQQRVYAQGANPGTGLLGGGWLPSKLTAGDWHEWSLEVPPGQPPSGGWPVCLFMQNQGCQQTPAAPGDFDSDSIAQANANQTQWLRHAALENGWAVVRVGMTGTNSINLAANDLGVWRQETSSALDLNPGTYGFHKPQREGPYAVQFVRSELCAKYDLNPDAIVVCGESGGGIAAAAACYQFDRYDPSNEDPFFHYSSKPNGLFFHNVVGYWPSILGSLGAQFWQTWNGSAYLPSVTTTISQANPGDLILTSPLVFMQASFSQDPAVNAANLEQKIRSLSIPVYLSTIDDVSKAYPLVWTGDGNVELPAFGNNASPDIHPVSNAFMLKEQGQRMEDRYGVGRAPRWLNARGVVPSETARPNLIDSTIDNLRDTARDAWGSFFPQALPVKPQPSILPRISAGVRGHSVAPTVAAP